MNKTVDKAQAWDTLVKRSAEVKRLTARVEELERALGNLIRACDQGRMVPRSGVSGMTIEAQARNSVLNGVPVWPVEEAREVWEQSRAAITKGEESQSWPEGFFPITPTWDQHCASEGCGQRVSVRLEVDGNGSVYCEPCAKKIAAAIRALIPSKP